MTDLTRLAAAAALLLASPALAAEDAPAAPASAAAPAAPASAAAPAAAPPAPAAEADAEGLDRETTVASSRRRRIRETPAVVTVLGRDELLASGARDLSEVLLRVPGFQLGVDVSSAVGAGFRGLWGHEGKILYLVDGIEMNDLSYGTFPLAQHLKLEQLERIEIIRGPGSALYGGNAELAVVNVVTRAATVQGGGLSATGGLLSGTPSAGALSAAAGGAQGGVRFGATASVGTGAASDRTYVGYAGDRLDLAGASEIRPATVTARLAWRALEVRALFDDYRVDARDAYGDVVARDLTARWRTAAVDARSSFDLGGNVTVTPRLTYRWEQPWQARDASLPETYYDVTNERLTGRVSATWDSLWGPSLVAGAEAFVERGRVNDFSNGLLSYGEAGESSVTNRSVAGVLEAGLDTSLANLLAGARLERHSEFGTSFVPRFAATRLFGPLHAKLLASGAYRAPSIENVNYQATAIRPERTWVFEGELGWQASDSIYAVANVFDLTVEKTIVFSFDGSDVYTNEGRTGSRGAEVEVQVRRGPHTGSLSYAYYDARDKNRVPAYEVAGDRARLVGFAGHKAVAAATLRPTHHLVLSPAVVFLSERAAYSGAEAPGEAAAGRVGARTYLDLFAAWRDLGARGLELGVGLRDALDEGAVFVQPYPGGHAPLPGSGREVWLRLRYDRG
jgi:outer membrane cobalamin receptor